MSKCKSCDTLYELSAVGGDYEKYNETLYEYFKQNLFNQKVYWNNKPISLKRFPEECGKEQSFFHLTTVSANKNVPYSDREPDFRRCERLHWIKPSIESDHKKLCLNDCFKVYEDTTGRKKRIKLFNYDERYLIILEENEEYYLLVTAFYIEKDYYLKGVAKAFQKQES